MTWTQVKAVNRHGAMAGWCFTRSATTETVDGFYRSESGKLTRLRYPGTRLTEATALNDQHVVVGWYEGEDRVTHGFQWTRSTGKYESFDAPFPGVTATIPSAVNAAGHGGATYLAQAPPKTAGATLVSGQWTSIEAPGAQVTTLEDLTDKGVILGFLSLPGEPGMSFVLEQGVYAPVAAPVPQATFTSALALSGQNLTVGYVEQDLPPPDPDSSPIIVFQGFVAPLPVLLGPPLPPPFTTQDVASRAQRKSVTLASATQDTSAPAPRQVQLDGCPDEPVPAGMVRPGKLAMSWAGYARVR